MILNASHEFVGAMINPYFRLSGASGSFSSWINLTECHVLIPSYRKLSINRNVFRLFSVLFASVLPKQRIGESDSACAAYQVHRCKFVGQWQSLLT